MVSPQVYLVPNKGNKRQASGWSTVVKENKLCLCLFSYNIPELRRPCEVFGLLKSVIVPDHEKKRSKSINPTITETITESICILVVSDYFSKWTEAIPWPVPKFQEKSGANAIINHFILKFCTPLTIHSDQ